MPGQPDSRDTPASSQVNAQDRTTIILPEDVARVGLDYAQVTLHSRRIREALASKGAPQMRIFDTCRIENGGVLPLQDRNVTPQGFVAFVPSAGASTRYLASFRHFAAAIQSGDLEASRAALVELHNLDFNKWAIPEILKTYLQNPDEILSAHSQEVAALNAVLVMPKALMPCTLEGHTFVEVKHLEHLAIGGLLAEFFVLSPGGREQVEVLLESLQKKSPIHYPRESMKSYCLLQGAALSTLRFDDRGCPLYDDTGLLSVVPAGHGTLVELFKSVKQSEPNSQNLLIRNIDNVMGGRPKAISETNKFMRFHQAILDHMRVIRDALDSGNLNSGHASCRALLDLTRSSQGDDEINSAAIADDPQLALYWRVQTQLFHTDKLLAQAYLDSENPLNREALRRLFWRPVNTMGQVPNNGQDVGGTPVFVDYCGLTKKLCIELPHASKDDQNTYLRDPSKATHFNPVFVAAEIPMVDDYYKTHLDQGCGDRLWIMAEKNFGNRPVYYHETVLYEILGNSLLANCCFVELDRSVFNPHKSLSDGSNHSLSYWNLYPN